MLERLNSGLTTCRAKSSKRKLPWLRGKPFALLLPLILTACQTTTRSDAINPGVDFCTAARAIYYSKHDTAPTIAQIREHNAVGVALSCGWLGAKK